MIVDLLCLLDLLVISLQVADFGFGCFALWLVY